MKVMRDFLTKAIVVTIALGAFGRAARAQAPQAYFEYQVDKHVTQVPGGPWPQYPDSLRIAKIDGQVIASFIVDTTGMADTTTLHILKSTHALFTAAVQQVLPKLRFTPAELHGVKVRQLVQQPFIFSMSP